MGNPSSTPIAPQQPNQAIYPILPTLELFTLYTRASYKAAFGEDAPPEDPTRPEQDWFDSTVSGPTTYNYFDPTSGALKQMTVSVPQTINLPGEPSYPPYVAAPSTATISPSDSTISGSYLSMESDAQSLVAIFKASDPNCSYSQEFAPGQGVFFITYPSTELRRYWNINYFGMVLNVGSLIAEANASGVGAPGQWTFSPGQAPTWQSAIPASVPALLTPTPLPLRSLLPNEKIVVGVLPGTYQIQRTDMQSPAPSSTGSYSPDIAATKTMVQSICKMMGLPVL